MVWVMKLQNVSFWQRFILGFFLIGCASFGTALAKSNVIKDIYVIDKQESTKIIFDLANSVNYDAFRLKNPNRIVVDLNQARLKTRVPSVKTHHQVIKNLRTAKRKNHAQRFVIDTRGKIDYKTYRLKPNKKFGHRLVVELKGDQPAIARTAAKPVQVKQTRRPSTLQKAPIIDKHASHAVYRDIVIAIDAGHGGQDPGALGKHGTREKDVVLRIAKRLKRLIDRQPGMRGVLVRKGDQYLPLRKRMIIARDAKADMFISIHADAYKNRRVKGSSVYVLSERGASDEAAKWLAERENAADLVGGVTLGDKDETLAKVLLDLSQTATIEASTRVADDVLKEIRQVAPVHKKSVQHARFVVLKSPDIPSILVETAFISNPREERRLNQNSYQEKLAKAMLKGIKNYFKKNPLPDTLVAQRNQALKVRPGDTLSDLALQHNVSISSLKRMNNLTSDKLYVGQTLKIPF